MLSTSEIQKGHKVGWLWFYGTFGTKGHIMPEKNNITLLESVQCKATCMVPGQTQFE